VPLKDPPRVGSCGHFSLKRPHLGSQPQARWNAVTRRLCHARAARTGGDSSSNFENCDLFHAQSHDTGRCVHARSWRANRDVDFRRQFLWFC